MNDIPLASRMVGKIVNNLWKVTNKRIRNENDHSGYFSSCYDVVNIEDSQPAFMKTFNYLYAFSQNNSTADILKMMTENFTYERDILQFCKNNRLIRIVTAIDSGEYKEDGEIISVPYLVFDIAQGNLKSYQAQKNPDLAWKLLCFHGSLVGLRQLHMHNIVHQDIKPSNILIFGDTISKLSDLGNATQLHNPSNWEKQGICGDLRYAPIELFYNYFSSDWETRRFAADLYMMGGILTYLITDSNFLSLQHQYGVPPLLWTNN